MGSEPTPDDESSDTPFSRTLDTAREQNDFNVVWEPFVNTKFHVPVEPRSGPDDTSDFKPLIRTRTDFLNGEPALMISENIRQLVGKAQREVSTIQLYGVQIIEMLPDTINLVVMSHNGAFVIPKQQIQSVRERIERPE